uniref:Uncharacterized protein n=1 Tax=Brassica oleracea var. oleracea TaxID=109376 RepID=A0A0D3CEH5_BRAOL
MASDVSQSTDQYMEQAQHGVQDVLNISTEIHVFYRTGQTDYVVYWTVPHTSGKELWLEPWPDDRSDRTGACFPVQLHKLKLKDRPNRRCNEPFRSSQGEADPKRRFLQFDVKEICENFEKGMMKALKVVSKIHMKSTSIRAPVAEPSLFISKKAKDYCRTNRLQPKHLSSLVLSPQVFEEEPLYYPHQGPHLDTRKPLDEDLGPIFDKEDEPGPVFDEEATSITSIVMESHLCFDPGTTHAPLSPDLQEHYVEKDMHVLKMNNIIAYLDKILERQVQPLRNESIDCAQQPEILRSFVVQTGYLRDASDRGSVQNGYLNIQKEGVMNFPNWRFSSPSIREYQTSKGDSGPRKKRPEPKPILYEPKVFPQSTSCQNQKHCTMDLRTNHFEEGGNDVPQSTDQSMEPAQHGVQDVLNISTEVHVFHRTGQTDRVVYWTVPYTSGKELWLEPWPDDRSDRTGACLSCPTSQAKAEDHSFSLLARLARTACTSDCADDLAALFDPIMDFSFGYFSKARILKLSEYLGHVGTRLVRSERPTALADRPAHVLILSALDTASSDESGQEPNSLLD